MPDNVEPKGGVSRRAFLRTSATTTTSVGILAGAGVLVGQHAKAQPSTGAVASGERLTLALTVNGKSRTLAVEPRTTLVEALRDTLGLTGTKIGCNHGQCGACTVLLDGRRVNACLVLAVAVGGSEVVTIEGLADPTGEPHAMQKAFAEKDAFQCGYCTPGQILSAVACIDEGHAGSAAEIREYMSGNLCRCGAYPNIVAAIESVRDGQKG